MADFSSKPFLKTTARFWPWFFFAAAFESLLAVFALLRIPSEGGPSPARLGVLAILIAFLLVCIYLGLAARRDPLRLNRFVTKSIILSSALSFLTSSLILFLLRYLNPEKLLPYFERLSPLLWYILLVGLQSFIFLLLVKNGFQLDEYSKRKPVYLTALIPFCILLFTLLFVTLTKIGVKPDTGYWGEPGVAILGWHFVLSIFVGFTCLLILQPEGNSTLAAKIILPLLLYVTAVVLWLSVPVDVLQNSFYAPITPPVNTPFPYSDAGFYDYLSQSLLLGTKYLGGIPPRPFYVLFLAILHFFLGQNYPAIITAQTLVLALFPVVLYYLGRKLHSPAAGVTAGLFAIFRELVGLWISSNTRVANSKIFTTDFPTAMGLAVLCLIFIWWLERRDMKSTIAAGGFFGLILLFRTQSLLILPVVFVLAWLVYQRKYKDWLAGGVVFATVMVLTVLPWLMRNHAMTGKFTFDDPSQAAIIFSQYSFSGNNDLSQYGLSNQTVSHRIISFTLEAPGYVARFITSHMLNTEIGGLLALPLIERFDGLSAPVNLYWVNWNGSLTWYNFVLVMIYLGVIAVGFGAAWRRTGWVGLLPLAINLGYTLANGIARFSSWRYNLPVDWVIYFYFAVGALEILGGLAILFGAKAENIFGAYIPRETRSMLLRDFRPQFVLIILAFMVTGALPWIAESLTKPRYIASTGELVTRLESSDYRAEDIQAFLSQEDAVLMEGQMLYPRLYRRNDGLSSTHPWAAYAVRDYARIGFILINHTRYDLIFPTKDVLDFPQGADTTVLACRKDDYLEVRVIDFGDKTFQSAPLSQPCQ